MLRGSSMLVRAIDGGPFRRWWGVLDPRPEPSLVVARSQGEAPRQGAPWKCFLSCGQEQLAYLSGHMLGQARRPRHL